MGASMGHEPGPSKMVQKLNVGNINCSFNTQMLHGAGIFTYIETPKKWPSHVGKYSSTMEHLGHIYLENLKDLSLVAATW